MKKKWLFSSIIAGVLAIIVVVQVIAGATFDYGELPSSPPEGQANWVAWNQQGELSPGFPYEILTEDNTNCELDEDIGYSEFGDGDTNVEWWIQIENFLYDPRTSPFSDDIYMVFGGLGDTYSGSLWRYTIEEWIITESQTEHLPEDVEAFVGSPCPTLYAPIEISGDATYQFFGAPGTYHVYRSQNASGAFNGASNGQYFYLDTVDTNSFGNGEFVDNTTEESWYIVIQADPDTNEIIGCHSEPADPTNVRVFDFTAAFNLLDRVVDLAWETASEFDILGFNVLRNTSKTGGREQLNEDLIHADNSGGSGGSSYDFVDDDIARGSTYYYWIEIVETGGGRESVGPRDVHTGFFFYIPFFN